MKKIDKKKFKKEIAILRKAAKELFAETKKPEFLYAPFGRCDKCFAPSNYMICPYSTTWCSKHIHLGLLCFPKHQIIGVIRTE